MHGVLHQQEAVWHWHRVCLGLDRLPHLYTWRHWHGWQTWFNDIAQLRLSHQQDTPPAGPLPITCFRGWTVYKHVTCTPCFNQDIPCPHNAREVIVLIGKVWSQDNGNHRAKLQEIA